MVESQNTWICSEFPRGPWNPLLPISGFESILITLLCSKIFHIIGIDLVIETWEPAGLKVHVPSLLETEFFPAIWTNPHTNLSTVSMWVSMYRPSANISLLFRSVVTERLIRSVPTLIDVYSKVYSDSIPIFGDIFWFDTFMSCLYLRYGSPYHPWTSLQKRLTRNDCQTRSIEYIIFSSLGSLLVWQSHFIETK